MRRGLLASTALTASSTLFAGAALAAPPVFSWTGCYIGANVGGAFTSINQNALTPPIPTLAEIGTSYDSAQRATSATGGGQLGCNWQFHQNWLIGFEGDINGLKASRSISYGGENTVVGSQTTSLRWLGTFRGRFGYVWDRYFLYATGGLAFGRVNSSVAARDFDLLGFDHSAYSGSYSAVRTGSTVGGGLEYAFTDRISGKVEYLHFDLGTANYNVSFVPGSGPEPQNWVAHAAVHGDIVRVGINFKLYP